MPGKQHRGVRGNLVEYAREVIRKLRVAVTAAARRRVGLAVAAGVVGDRPEALAGQCLRAVNDVATLRRQAVEHGHRQPFTGHFPGDRVVVERRLELGCGRCAQAASTASRASERALARCSTSL
jgi:hypothetical protein